MREKVTLTMHECLLWRRCSGGKRRSHLDWRWMEQPGTRQASSSGTPSLRVSSCRSWSGRRAHWFWRRRPETFRCVPCTVIGKRCWAWTQLTDLDPGLQTEGGESTRLLPDLSPGGKQAEDVHISFRKSFNQFVSIWFSCFVVVLLPLVEDLSPFEFFTLTKLEFDQPNYWLFLRFRVKQQQIKICM